MSIPFVCSLTRFLSTALFCITSLNEWSSTQVGWHPSQTKRRASSNSSKASCNHYKNLLTHDKLPTKSKLQMTLSFAAMCVSQQLKRKNAGIQAKIQPRNMPNEIEHTRPLIRDLNETLRLSPCTKLPKFAIFVLFCQMRKMIHKIIGGFLTSKFIPIMDYFLYISLIFLNEYLISQWFGDFSPKCEVTDVIDIQEGIPFFLAIFQTRF